MGQSTSVVATWQLLSLEGSFETCNQDKKFCVAKFKAEHAINMSCFVFTSVLCFSCFVLF